jgi:peptide-methionine (R)-S-oxide reductase
MMQSMAAGGPNHNEDNMSTEPQVVKTEAQWQAELTPEQYHILREKGTERAFTGKYVDTHKDGTYTCAGCGAELFDASTKFESGSGWPSFYEPKNTENVELRPTTASS